MYRDKMGSNYMNYYREQSNVDYTLINKSLNGYGDSPSNGFRWKSYIDLAF